MTTDYETSVQACDQLGDLAYLSRVPNRITPLKLWEIEHCYRCPVVGMCLPLADQKQFLKRAGYSFRDKTPFEIHELIVASLEDENRLSRKVENFLSRNFGKEALSLLQLSQEDFILRWKSAFASGDYLGILYAAAIHPRLSKEVKKEIFGEIHMTMHWSGTQVMKLRREMERRARRLEDMRTELKDAAKLRRALQKENAHLEKDRKELAASLGSAEKNLVRQEEQIAERADRRELSRIEGENARLREEVAMWEETCRKQQLRIDSLMSKNEAFASEVERLRQANLNLMEENRDKLVQLANMKRCDESCPSFDLCKKRILIVGGITKMESRYRDIIENNGGVFDYHDGYMRSGSKSLEVRLKRADIVLCPINCNSHAACSVVKNLGKKHRKPVHMLANSSLTAVSKAISDMNT